MRLLPRRRRESVSKTAERATVGIAVATLAAAGAVITGEVMRLMQRRAESKEGPPPGTIGEAAGIAALDTVNVARTAYNAAPRSETVLFNILSGFLGAFSLVRLSTWGIRGGWWPTNNVVLGETHVHHFVPGILLAFGAGGAALVTENERSEEALAIAFGAGMGLTFDEAALLLDLRDVYWTPQGLLSIQISLATAGMLSATILAMRMLRRGERKAEEQELIPHADGRETVPLRPADAA